MCVAAAIVGTAAVSSAVSARGASKAAKAQQQAAQDSSAIQERIANADREQQQQQYQQTRNDFAPYRGIGYGAINNLARIAGISTPGYSGEFNAARYLAENPDLAAVYGRGRTAAPVPQLAEDGSGINGAIARVVNFQNQMLPQAQADQGIDEEGLRQHWEQYGSKEGRRSPFDGAVAGTAGGAPDMSSFFTSPDYNFRRDEGMRGLGNSFAAQGGAFSGNALRALSEFNSNLASGEFGNYWNRMAGLADMGQGGTAQTANAGANMANQISGINQNLAAGQSRNTLAAGDARASGITGRYNALSDGLGFIGGLGASYAMNNPNMWRGTVKTTGLPPSAYNVPRY